MRHMPCVPLAPSLYWGRLTREVTVDGDSGQNPAVVEYMERKAIMFPGKLWKRLERASQQLGIGAVAGVVRAACIEYLDRRGIQ